MARQHNEEHSTHPGMMRAGHDDRGPGIATYAGTLAAVTIGAALIEEELVAGVLLGAAALIVPNLIPKAMHALRPALKATLRAGYNMAASTRETMAEASEQFQDIVAEVRSEENGAEEEEQEHVSAGRSRGAGSEQRKPGKRRA